MVDVQTTQLFREGSRSLMVMQLQPLPDCTAKLLVSLKIIFTRESQHIALKGFIGIGFRAHVEVDGDRLKRYSYQVYSGVSNEAHVIRRGRRGVPMDSCPL